MRSLALPSNSAAGPLTRSQRKVRASPFASLLAPPSRAIASPTRPLRVAGPAFATGATLRTVTVTVSLAVCVPFETVTWRTYAPAVRARKAVEALAGASRVTSAGAETTDHW